MSVLNLIRPDLMTIQGYIPGGDDLAYRLHANELPWAPVSLDTVAINHYPDFRQQQRLQEQIASYYQIDSEQMLLTRGSDDGIDFLMRLFLTAGQDSFMQCPPTFPMYEFYAGLQQAKTINCPLDADNGFSLPVEKLFSLWQANCKLIMLCRPNNPTANLIDLATIAQICEQFRSKAVIVVDEAYIEFAQVPSATTLLSSFDNLIVLRTLSKAYGMAGLRLGALIAQPQLIKIMQNAMPPYTLSSPVIHLAQQALENKPWFDNKIQQIVKDREVLNAQLKQSAWIKTVYPSCTNFILVASPHAQALAAWFAELDIAVRYFAAGSLQNMLRITVGDKNQNQRLLAALNSFQP
ncbi:Histidinol-phosphate aminotransferase [Legionella massiliensis]|uniref:Histidinol-phosphate aminotransferase n=1 Tax=Legionella massiliensis TaxID=1034943 RepID=A0A078L1F8_9GAMM|nr:histidinol-phosphate transaminase [Legionella massiliensis]CDZ79031.1 Histidinol-phosphate aminotransferase [Legionella massiliensis]CEE14769.1 Histidinol-phosphate aminotransferase [Legionella massiliensis]